MCKDLTKRNVFKINFKIEAKIKKATLKMAVNRFDGNYTFN